MCIYIYIYIYNEHEHEHDNDDNHMTCHQAVSAVGAQQLVAHAAARVAGQPEHAPDDPA